ncbi:MAG: manganese efflux pump [Deltaproteobacteria bacterium]|nr:manganese efflux pump [Deltaproteobacteria bacterium]
MHHDLVVMGKVFTVAFAVGLDVLALSIGVGVARLSPGASVRVGSAFAVAEIAMQLIGYGLGAGASRMLGEVADDVSLALLFLIGSIMIAKSFEYLPEGHFDTAQGAGLMLASLSISVDSLGVGMALPALGIPLVPLLVTISITTISFSLTGLAFGALLGERYERGAEGAAGATLVLLAGALALQRMV